MANFPIILDHDAQQDHLLVTLALQLRNISNALVALSGMTTDPTYVQADVDDLVRIQGLIEARIAAIKANGSFSYPDDDEMSKLGSACDALAAIDVTTAAAGALITAANEVVAALPVDATK